MFNRYVALLGGGGSWFCYKQLRKNGGEGRYKLFCYVMIIKKND